MHADADVLIVGGGPAGLSAALTLVRQRHSVLLFDMANSRALPSANLHGTPGTDGKRPSDVLEQFRAEAASYAGFAHVAARIVHITHDADNVGFDAEDDQGHVYHALKVILCNGVKDTFPEIPGYAEAWGKGIFHNPFAQGYQRDVSTSHSGVLAVDWIAMPKYTLHLAHLLSQLTSTVTIYTHGNTELASHLESRLVELTANKTSSTVKVDNRTIARLALESPTQSTMQINFADNTSTTEAFLGHAAKTSLNAPFASQLGINLSPSGAEYVVSGPANQTNVDGVYAAGDAMTMLKVWPSAVASGSVTAAGVAIALQEERWGLPSIFA